MYLKVLKKTLRYVFALLAILIVGLFLWLNFGVYTFTNRAERDDIIAQVKSAPALPERFMKIYTKVNEEEINKSVSVWLLHALNGHSYYQQPHVKVAEEVVMLGRRGEIMNIAAMAFFLERNVTVTECIQFRSAYMDFTHGCIGVQKAAVYYYHKTLPALSDDEMIGLIAMYKNPSLYNPLRKSSSSFRIGSIR
nr:transglycosylase domain-containing protein [uncultured Flavobacterium sp.]